ncbi:hypothetical protein PMAYCL1PPCAC_22347, partial [Pristionchus mayeri]
QQLKRSANHHVNTGLGDSHYVCNTIVTEHYRPTHRHDYRGKRVEIQQDEDAEFVATYRVCESQGARIPCFGIDKNSFTSECAPEFVIQKASIRPMNSTAAFSLGDVRVPVACNCRVREIL